MNGVPEKIPLRNQVWMTQELFNKKYFQGKYINLTIENLIFLKGIIYQRMYDDNLIRIPDTPHEFNFKVKRFIFVTIRTKGCENGCSILRRLLT